MIRGLLFCAFVCGLWAPALAGERGTTVRAVWVLPPLDLPASGHSRALGSALMIVGDFTITLHGAPSPTVSLADFEDRMVVAFDPASDLDGDPAVAVSPYAVRHLPTLAAWRLTARLDPVTASASAFYAVRDTLGEARKPRVFRPTALSTTLMLRIDGRDDTPALGIGGGGVAAALWRARPR